MVSVNSTAFGSHHRVVTWAVVAIAIFATLAFTDTCQAERIFRGWAVYGTNTAGGGGMLDRIGGTGPTGPYNYVNKWGYGYDGVSYVVVSFWELLHGQQGPIKPPKPHNTNKGGMNGNGNGDGIIINDGRGFLRVRVDQTREVSLRCNKAPVVFVKVVGRNPAIATVSTDSDASTIAVTGVNEGQFTVTFHLRRRIFPTSDLRVYKFELTIQVVDEAFIPGPGEEKPGDAGNDADHYVPAPRMIYPDSGYVVSGDVYTYVTQDNPSQDACWTGFEYLWTADLPDSLLGGTSIGFATDTVGTDGWSGVWDTDTTAIRDGAYTLQVTMQDTFGNIGLLEVPVTLDNYSTPDQVPFEDIKPYGQTEYLAQLTDTLVYEYPGDQPLEAVQDLMAWSSGEGGYVTWVDDWRLSAEDGSDFFVFQEEACDSLNAFLSNRDPYNEGHREEATVAMMKGMMYVSSWDIALIAIEDAEGAGGDSALIAQAHEFFQNGIDAFRLPEIGSSPAVYTTDPPQRVWDSDEVTESINWFGQGWQAATDSWVSGISTGEVPSTAFVINHVQPNPTGGGLQASLSIPRIGDLRVVLYDVQGAEIHRFFDGTIEVPGIRTLTWNGVLAGGTRIHPGVYLLKAEFGGQIKTRKIVVVR